MFKSTITIPLLTEIATRTDLTLADAVVYSVLRFKYKLSEKNNDRFKDQDGIYILHQQSEIMELTGISKRKVIDAMEKLESEAVGLIRRVKLGRSFKIYFNEYDVEDRFLVSEKSQNEPQNASNGVDPSVTSHETENAVEGDFNVHTDYVDNIVDNVGIISFVSDPLDTIGAENAHVDNVIGAENAPKSPIGAKIAPYNKIYNNNTRDNINNNNFTLPKGHTPKVTIDYDLYTTFSKCFSKKPSVQVKNAINGLINRGIEKDLIIEIMQEIGQKGWSWGKALDQLNQLALDGIKAYDQYVDHQLEDQEIVVSNERLEAFRKHAHSIPTEYIQGLIHAERSEWDGIDQMTFA